MIQFIKPPLGLCCAALYGYLKWNKEGYWFLIPFILLAILLIIEGNND